MTRAGPDLAERLARLGFDTPRLKFTFRTSLASCAALLVASQLGLDHPQWAAMTVWAASQPTRGQLIEKGFFRFAGTVSGVVAGVTLMYVSRGAPALLVCGLAVWIALCAAIGNLQRGFIAYGTMLAGYSASMVTLLDSSHPDHILAIGADRLATILVGVVLAVAWGLLFAPRQAEGVMIGRLRHVCARTLRHLRQATAAPGDPRVREEQYELLAAMAAIEEALDPHGAGSLASRRQAREARAVLMAAIALLPLARRPDGGGTGAPLSSAPLASTSFAGALDAAATVLETSGEAAPVAQALDAAIRACGHDTRLAEALAGLGAALHVVLAAAQEPGIVRPQARVILHRDFVGALGALIRAGLAMLAVGVFWLATGWSGGPFLLLGTSIMISLFSSFENPARAMTFVAAGQAIGAAGALACRFLVWPFAHDTLGLVLLTMPFILVAPLFFAHRRTQPVAFDYAMVSLLLLHPVYPPVGTLSDMLQAALAVVAAPLVAMAAYRLVFPLDAGRRLATMIAMMVRELEQMARSPDAPARRLTWRARLYHRLLGLTRLAERAGASRAGVVDGGLAVLATGSAILALREALDTADLPPAAARALTIALGRLERVARAPRRAASALERAGRHAVAAGLPQAAAIAAGGRALSGHAAFFETGRAGGGIVPALMRVPLLR